MSNQFPCSVRPGHVRRHLRRVAVPSRSPSTITACYDCMGMSDGKRLNSSLDILKRHYPQVTSLQTYIYSILSNATQVALTLPDDPEDYQDLLEKSKVGYHQLPCQKYHARESIFEIDEVGPSHMFVRCPTYNGIGHQKVAMVPPPSSRF